MDPFTKAARSFGKKGSKRFTKTGEFTPTPYTGVFTDGGEGLRDRLTSIERQAQKGQRNIGVGPGDPPEDFVGGTTSLTEWYVWWALDILSKRQNFQFDFQESFQGGRYIPGGSVADFVVYLGLDTIILRVQTFYFHLAGDEGSQTIQYDYRQEVGVIAAYDGDIDVINLYDTYFIGDDTGAAVLRVVEDALNGIEWPNPLATGLTVDPY